MRTPLRSRARGFASALYCTVTLAGASLLLLPATVGAYATLAPGPVPGATGLPEGRVYEEVSPPNKLGNEAGGPDNLFYPMMMATADGNGILYSSNGPIGNSATGVQSWTVAKRTGTGDWENTGVMPLGLGEQGFKTTYPDELEVSPDLSKVVFHGATDEASYVPNETSFEPGRFPGAGAPDIFTHDIGSQSTEWLGWPAIANPLPDNTAGQPSSGEFSSVGGALAGGSPDLSTVYFNFWGTLTPEDNSPNAALGNISRAEVLSHRLGTFGGDPGFYEWHEGRLTSAGVLPDGSVDPYGAVSAASATVPNGFYGETLQNEVSENGDRAFFVSPAPFSGSGRAPELYVRETAADGTQRTVLVSRDTLLPDVNGLPASAPTGPLLIHPEPLRHSYMYASPDGSRAFFVSADALTSAAPNDASGKFYEFDLDTETLTYLPGVAGPTINPHNPSGDQVLASTTNGSSFLFEKLVGHEGSGTGTQMPSELDVSSHGVVTPIVPLPEKGEGITAGINFARTTTDGSAFIFQTTLPLPGFNDGGTHFSGPFEEPNSEVFRYEAATDKLSCLSCPPAGITPTCSGEFSSLNSVGIWEVFAWTLRNNGISADGSKVFFESPEPLVPQDTNGVMDAYEWENGKLYLLSTGKSEEPSYFGDNSANGDDVFISTAEGLAAGDTDGGYDVYDTRVPRPGDSPPAVAVPCAGDVCQGPPSVSQLLSSPASATFSGLGNSAPQTLVAAAKSRPKKKTAAQVRAEKLAGALKSCKAKRSRVKRVACETLARRRYGSKSQAKAKKSNRGDR
jgi:hypothetical protein